MGYDDIDPNSYNTGFTKFASSIFNALDKPATWFRENVVTPNQKDYNYYHRKYRRVPTVDQCDTLDIPCIFEADEQFKRDKDVDSALLNILRQRFENCVIYERPDDAEKCMPLYKTIKEAETSWFIKYGDLGAFGASVAALMKQKHRLAWERRHGPVGTGTSPKSEE